MPRDLSHLGTARVPNASELSGVQGYLEQYNRAYSRLAENLIKAIDTIRTNYDKNFGEEMATLGALRLKLGANKSIKEPFTLKISGGNRFYPEELKLSEGIGIPPVTGIPSHQLEKLYADLIGKAKKPVNVEVAHKISVDKGKPLEGLLLGFYVPVPTHHTSYPINYSLKINPNLIENKESDVYRGNSILAAFETTQSSEHIPIGYNRLALMNAVLEYLVEEINQREGRVNERTERLQKLQPAEVEQRRLF